MGKKRGVEINGATGNFPASVGGRDKIINESAQNHLLIKNERSLIKGKLKES